MGRGVAEGKKMEETVVGGETSGGRAREGVKKWRDVGRGGRERKGEKGSEEAGEDEEKIKERKWERDGVGR